MKKLFFLSICALAVGTLAAYPTTINSVQRLQGDGLELAELSVAHATPQSADVFFQFVDAQTNQRLTGVAIQNFLTAIRAVPKNDHVQELAVSAYESAAKLGVHGQLSGPDFHHWFATVSPEQKSRLLGAQAQGVLTAQ